MGTLCSLFRIYRKLPKYLLILGIEISTSKTHTLKRTEKSLVIYQRFENIYLEGEPYMGNINCLRTQLLQKCQIQLLYEAISHVYIALMFSIGSLTQRLQSCLLCLSHWKNNLCLTFLLLQLKVYINTAWHVCTYASIKKEYLCD